MSSINERIRKLVNEFSGVRLSEMTGISTTQLHRLKSEGETTGKNILLLANATNRNPLWVLSGQGPEKVGDPEPTPPPPPEFSADEIEMINLFRAAPLQTKLKAFQILSEG